MREPRKDYTTAELGRMAGVNQSRIRQLLLAGESFPNASKRAGAWFIPADEAEAWLAHRKSTKTPSRS